MSTPYPSGLLTPPLPEIKPRPFLPPGKRDALGRLPRHIIERISSFSDYGALIALRQCNTLLHHTVNPYLASEESRIALVLQAERYFARHRPRTSTWQNPRWQEGWGCFGCYAVLPVRYFSIEQPKHVVRLDLPGHPVVTPRRLCICCSVACGLYPPGRQIQYRVELAVAPARPDGDGTRANGNGNNCIRETWICTCPDVRAYLENDYRVGLYACPRCRTARPLSRQLSVAEHAAPLPEITYPTPASRQSTPSSPVMAIDFVLSPASTPGNERDEMVVDDMVAVPF